VPLKLDRGAEEVPSTDVCEEVVERLGVTGGGGEATDDCPYEGEIGAGGDT
jgi:hypothetical protein